MAYRRCVTARTKSFYQQQQRLAPSFSHISTSDREEVHTNCISSRNSEIRSYIHNHFFITRNNSSKSLLSRNAFQLRPSQSHIGVGFGLVSHRNLSSASGGEREPFEIEILNDTEVFNDMVGVVGGKAVEVAPVMNEVAVAAVDSFTSVATLQYLVDYVHCYTGFNWWASIAVTTLLLRFIQLPLIMHLAQFVSILRKLATTKFLEDDPNALEEESAIRFQLEKNKISKLHVSAFVISCVISWSFYFAILNMAEKVPSFRTGGTLWFTDLTIPDRILFPLLLTLTIWIRPMLIPRRHAKGSQCTNNRLSGGLVFLGCTIAEFPNAVYCFWITSNLFNIALLTVVTSAQCQKLLRMLLTRASSNKKP